MANTTTKRRFDGSFATRLVLIGALSFVTGVMLRTFQIPAEKPQVAAGVVQVGSAQPIAKPAPAHTQKPSSLTQPQPKPRIIRVVRVIRRPIAVTRGS